MNFPVSAPHQTSDRIALIPRLIEERLRARCGKIGCDTDCVAGIACVSVLIRIS